jgi:hypothetical protein
LDNDGDYYDNRNNNGRNCSKNNSKKFSLVSHHHPFSLSSSSSSVENRLLPNKTVTDASRFHYLQWNNKATNSSSISMQSSHYNHNASIISNPHIISSILKLTHQENNGIRKPPSSLFSSSSSIPSPSSFSFHSNFSNGCPSVNYIPFLPVVGLYYSELVSVFDPVFSFVAWAYCLRVKEINCLNGDVLTKEDVGKSKVWFLLR